MPVSDAVEALNKAARDYGIREGEPEGVFVKAMGDALVAFDSRLDAASKRNEEAIKGVVRRAATAALSDAGKAYQRSQTWRSVAALALTGVVLLGVGFGSGYLYDGATRAGAAGELANLAAQCAATAVQQSGGKACTIRLWIEAPPRLK